MRPRTDFWLTVVLFLVLGAPACAPPTNYDLAITDARVFDVHTGQAPGRSTILIRDGLMTEGSASNIFVVVNDTLVTPPKGPFILPGVTRDLVLELAHAHRIACVERPVTEAELRTASEVMLSSSIKELLPITRLDGRPVGSGKPGPRCA